MIVYISIGNSDDKLTQAEWARFHMTVHETLMRHTTGFHGVWTSGPTAFHQNACWCADVEPHVEKLLRNRLAAIAGEYRQDSIAWAPAPVTEFITPGPFAPVEA